MRMKILVTGTSRGLGLEIARELSVEHEVVGVARNDVSQESASELAFRHVSGVDLSKPEAVDELAPILAECDGLVNNAALAHDGILATQSLQDIEQMVTVNLVSVVYLTKVYIRERLANRKSGVIVNVGSVVSNRGYRGLAVYSATKGGLNSFTRALAREMGAKGFRINTILPGFVETAMSSGLAEAQRDQIIRRTPLGRLGTARDISPVVRFLLSSEAAFVTGQEFVVDGGLTA